LAPAGAVLAFVYLGPLAYAFHASFTAWSLTLPGSDKIYVGLENYQDVLGSREYWRAVTVTLSYALSAVLIELVLGTLFALLLNLDFFARGLFRSLMVIPMVLKYPHNPTVLKALDGETFGYIPMKESEQIHIMMYDEANAACAKLKTPEQATEDLQRKAVQFMTRRGYLRG
jgi:ABC-type sugar transport system permease subunit